MSLAPKLIALMARAAAAWSPTDKSVAINLSLRNTLATRDASSSGLYRSCRAQTGHGTSKRYFEIEVTVGSVGGLQTVMGVGTTAATLADYVGFDTFGYGINEGGEILHGGPGPGLLPAFNTGDILRFAVDLDAHLIWLSVVGLDWNDDPTANPATGVGGLTIASGTYFPMFSGASDTQASTLNVGHTGFAGTVPSGFTAWR